jgi:prepilin-type N-terminal cleavage/methylation domain-containing protein
MKKQQGFTLVEIAIVMVIIGLLLGGVLKGQAIIKNAQIKNLENSANSVATAIYSYQDRYRALPGDDSRTDTRFGLAATQKGDGTGMIDDDFDSNTANDESRLLWLHLRNAGLVNGDDTDQTQPINSFSGLIGASTDTTANGGIATNTILGLFIGFTQIPEDVALILDSRNDDGLANSGSIQTNQTNYTGGNIHSVFFEL